MTLKERLASEESKTGKFVKNWIGKLLLFIAAIGSLSEYFAVLPPDMLPKWLKLTIVFAGAISFVAGKLTVKANNNEAKS